MCLKKKVLCYIKWYQTIFLQSFQSCSVSKVVEAETDHEGMVLTLEVQTKIPVARET